MNNMLSSTVSENLVNLYHCRKVHKEKKDLFSYWIDPDPFTGAYETYKTLDAFYSFVIGLNELNSRGKLTKFDKISDHKGSTFSLEFLSPDLLFLFNKIEEEGFFPIPYIPPLPPEQKPQTVDMASTTCEVCTRLLTGFNDYLDSSLIKKTKTLLAKSIKILKNSATEQTGERYTWKGWIDANYSKSKSSLRIEGSTYFTALCCTALVDYTNALDKDSSLDLGFRKQDLKNQIVGGLRWLISRYNEKEKIFYKYQDNRETCLYWATFALLSLANANLLLKTEDVKDIDNIVTKSKKLMNTVIDELYSGIHKRSSIFERESFWITSKNKPATYQDRICLGSMTLSLLRFAEEYDFRPKYYDYVVNSLMTEVKKLVESKVNIIYTNHYNLRAYIEWYRWKYPEPVSIYPKETIKTINDIIDKKVNEMKALIKQELEELT